MCYQMSEIFSLRHMRNCKEKVWHLPLIHFRTRNEKPIALRKSVTIWTAAGVCPSPAGVDGLRFPWPPASTVRALSLEGQLPSAFAWSCLFNLTQWRKAWHWPESAALMCFMFCIHHCQRAPRKTASVTGGQGRGGCVCVCGAERRQEWNTCACCRGKTVTYFENPTIFFEHFFMLHEKTQEMIMFLFFF